MEIYVEAQRTYSKLANNTIAGSERRMLERQYNDQVKALQAEEVEPPVVTEEEKGGTVIIRAKGVVRL